MSNFNYPLANDTTCIIRDYLAKILLEKSGIVTKTLQRKTFFGYTFNTKLGGKIKSIFGLIYFFSLLFFTIKLFT